MIRRKTVLHLFGAIGGGARGFKRARVQVANMQGEWQCLGSMDIDARANRVFAARVGIPAIDIDFADRGQYMAINGHEPPTGWREATPGDIRRACGGPRPDCVFLSAPCKGFSGLLPEAKSANPKYQAMNGLAQRALWLLLEAWPDDPVPMLLFENVPRLMTRGRAFADQLVAMMGSYGYICRETVHDCGELGGLGQSRKRCLIVARHPAKVPNFLYEPPRRALRTVGDVIGGLWLPGEQAAGPLHRLPQLQWKTWVRLAFVQAGSDWRSLNRLAVEDGHLRDYLIVPAMHAGGYGVRRWTDTCGTVQSESRPSNGAFSVADPRFSGGEYQQYGVRRWADTSGAVSAQSAPGGGAYSVADPRLRENPARHTQMYRVVRWDRSASTITGSQQVGSGAGCVSDPRQAGPGFAKYAVTGWDGSTGTVISGSTTGQGAFAVADPRSGMSPERTSYLTGGHYGVTPWCAPTGAVSASACHDNGPWSVADPRPMPQPGEQLVACIRALDDTWHRPFTTLELAALQGLFDAEDPADVAAFTDALVAESSSDSQHREWIGNAVPPPSAQAIGAEILRTLLLADAGESFALSAVPIWVRPLAVALSLAEGGAA